MKEEQWIECRVSPGMFRDERVVEVSGRSFFVDEKSVRKEQGHFEVLVTIIQTNGHKRAVLPTRLSESIELGA